MPTPPRNAQGTRDARDKGAMRSVKARARRQRIRAVIELLKEVDAMKAGKGNRRNE